MFDSRIDSSLEALEKREGMVIRVTYDSLIDIIVFQVSIIPKEDLPCLVVSSFTD